MTGSNRCAMLSDYKGFSRREGRSDLLRSLWCLCTVAKCQGENESEGTRVSCSVKTHICNDCSIYVFTWLWGCWSCPWRGCSSWNAHRWRPGRACWGLGSQANSWAWLPGWCRLLPLFLFHPRSAQPGGMPAEEAGGSQCPLVFWRMSLKTVDATRWGKNIPTVSTPWRFPLLLYGYIPIRKTWILPLRVWARSLQTCQRNQHRLNKHLLFPFL